MSFQIHALPRDTFAPLFALERTDYIHLHYAKPGCYACRVVRA